jgi:hypothetical protein
MEHMSTRLKTIAAAAALIALSTTAHAQTYGFSQAQLGQISPISFVTTSQQLLASADVAASTVALVSSETSREEKSVLDRMLSPENFVSSSIVAADDDEKTSESKEEAGFFGSTMGRASLVGLASLAGASYFALRPAATAAAPVSFSTNDSRTPSLTPPTAANLPGIITGDVAVLVNPEPSTWVLMATGLGFVGMVARRRRTS